MVRFLKSKAFQVLILLLLTCLAVYWLAGILKMEEQWQAVALVLILGALIAVVAAVRKMIQTRRLPWQSGEDRSQDQGGQEGLDLRMMKESFEEAMAELERLRPHRGFFRGKIDTDLPWILVIGPPGGGKSTAIEVSQLRFTPLGKALRGFGGTRNCTWWLSEDAILLDTAGRYVQPEKHQAEWLEFLKRLKRHRPARPVDAAILQIGFDELETLSEQQVQTFGMELRARLEEIMSQLGVRFQIHLVLSKCDQLVGFTEVFASLSPDERNEALGFPLNSDDLQGGTVAERLRTSLETLVMGLSRRVATRVCSMRDREQQLACLLFPGELERRTGALEVLVEALFQPMRTRENPWLTHVYFISATQDGTRLPDGRAALGDSLGMAPPPLARGGSLQTPPTFVRGLMRQVLHLSNIAARPTREALRKQKRARRLLLTGMSLLIGIVSFVGTDATIEQRRWMKQLGVHAAQLEQISTQLRLPNQAGQSISPRILRSHLKAQWDLLRHLDENPGSVFVAPVVETGRTYLGRQAEQTWILPFKSRWNDRLYDVAHAPKVSGSIFAAAYLTLKADLVLRDAPRRAIKRKEAVQWLGRFVATRWWGFLPPTRAEDPTLTQHTLELLLSRVLTWALPSRLQLDARLIASARKRLKSPIGVEEALHEIHLADTGLDEVVQPLQQGSRSSERTPYIMPSLKLAYTREGCRTYFSKKTEGEEWWLNILGEGAPQGLDYELLYQRHLVAATTTWQDGLRLEPVPDLKASIRVIEGLLSSEFQLERLFSVAAGMGQSRQIQDELANSSRQESAATDVMSRAFFWSQYALFLSWLSPPETIEDKKKAAKTKDPPQCADVWHDSGLLLLADAASSAPIDEDAAPAAKFKTYREALETLLGELNRVDNGSPKIAFKILQPWQQDGTGPLLRVSIARIALMDALELKGVPVSGIDRFLASIEVEVLKQLSGLARVGLQSKWKEDVYSIWMAKDLDDCPDIQGFVQDKVRSFVETNLYDIYDTRLRRPKSFRLTLPSSMKAAGPVQIILNRNALGRLNRALRKAERACKEEGGGKPAEKPSPRFPRALRLDGTCKTDVDQVGLKAMGQERRWEATRGGLFNPGSNVDSNQVRLTIKLEEDSEHMQIKRWRGDWEDFLRNNGCPPPSARNRSLNCTLFVRERDSHRCAGTEITLTDVWTPYVAPEGDGGKKGVTWSRGDLPRSLK